MKTTAISLAGALLLALLTWSAAQALPQQAGPEYLVVRLNYSIVDIDFAAGAKARKVNAPPNVLTSLARDGWRLVSVVKEEQTPFAPYVAFLAK